MRFALLTLLFVVGVTATAQARLGENADQLVQRYGDPLRETDQKSQGDKIALAQVTFQKGGFQVNVTLVDGISVSETFSKINDEAVTLAEVQILLNANSQGFGWEAPKTIDLGKRWARDDGAVAILAHGILTITSKELIAKETTAKKLEDQPSLDGF
jgi:hypothetical protein